MPGCHANISLSPDGDYNYLWSDNTVVVHGIVPVLFTPVQQFHPTCLCTFYTCSTLYLLNFLEKMFLICLPRHISGQQSITMAPKMTIIIISSCMHAQVLTRFHSNYFLSACLKWDIPYVAFSTISWSGIAAACSKWVIGWPAIRHNRRAQEIKKNTNVHS